MMFLGIKISLKINLRYNDNTRKAFLVCNEVQVTQRT